MKRDSMNFVGRMHFVFDISIGFFPGCVLTQVMSNSRHPLKNGAAVPNGKKLSINSRNLPSNGADKVNSDESSVYPTVSQDVNTTDCPILNKSLDRMEASPFSVCGLPVTCQRKYCWGNTECSGNISVGSWENVKHLKDSYEDPPDLFPGEPVVGESIGCDSIEPDIEKQMQYLSLEDEDYRSSSAGMCIGEACALPLSDIDSNWTEAAVNGTASRNSRSIVDGDSDPLWNDLCADGSQGRYVKSKSHEEEEITELLVGESDTSFDSMLESSQLLQDHVILLDLNKDLSPIDPEEDSANSVEKNTNSGKVSVDPKKERTVPKFVDSKSGSERAKAIPHRRNSNDGNEWKYVNSPNSHDHEMRTVENIAGSPKVSIHCNLCEGFQLEMNDFRSNCADSDGAQSHSHSILNSCSFAQLSSLVSANTDSANVYTREMMRRSELLEEIDDDLLIDLSFYKPVVPLGPPILYSSYENDKYTISLGDLPIELVQKILSYFSPQDLCKSIAPVCKRWYQLAYDPALWKHLSFWHTVSSFTLCRVISRAPFLRRLNLRGRSGLAISEVATFSQYCTNLKVIDLGFCEGLNYKVLELIVLNCPLLEDLNMEGCSQIDHNCIKPVVNLPKLKRLNLSHCTLLSDESVILIASSLQNLHSLNIDGISWIYDE
jgi:hypothetical protein